MTRESEKLKNNSLTSFGLRLLKIREEQNLTQSQMANKLGISRSWYSELELDQKRPTLQLLQTLGTDGVDLNWLILGDRR